MKEIKVYNVNLPLKVPFETSFGIQYSRNALIIEYSDEYNAYGESVTDDVPGYSYEDNITALHVIKDYLIEILKETLDPSEFVEKAKKIKGHNMAKSAIETMLWDLESKKKGISLKDLIGGEKEKIESGISIGILPMEKLIDTVKKSIDLGYKRIKLKIKPGWDIEVLREIRKNFGDIPLTVDANQAYEGKENKVLELDKFELLMIEQPLAENNMVGLSRIQKKLSTPICLDESIHSVKDAKTMLELDAGRIINLKIGRVGGLKESLEIVNFCGNNKIPLWCGGMLETGIGRAFNVILQSRMEFNMPGDTSPSDRYFEKDIIKKPFTMDKGYIEVPNGNGIGVEPDLEFIKKVGKIIFQQRL
ncbi:MAG: o-succinylbenzoate synthase [Thermoplasmata archaeon]|nr:o-succinylbenzoate synthase [Thermoplasmata archaeon]